MKTKTAVIAGQGDLFDYCGDERRESALVTPVEERVIGAGRVEVFARVINAVWLFISAGCVINTVHNIYGFMNAAGASVFFAGLTAVLVSIVTSVFVYTAGLRVEWRAPLYTLGLSMMFFSIFCTVAVNYSAMKEADAAYALAVRYGNETLELERINETAIQDADAVRASLERDLAVKTADAEYWKTRVWRKYEERQAAVKETERDLAAARARKNTLLEERKEILRRKSANSEIEQKTAFVFLSEITGLSDKTIQFFILLISGLFYDITAPLAFALGFSITKGDKDGK
jgi:hypothetical protein